MGKLIDLTGRVFGRLTVLSRAVNNKNGQSRWNCVCECKNICTVFGSNLKRGHTESCGCLWGDVMNTHGMVFTRPYTIWSNMKNRCINPNAPKYTTYGGRGISYDTRWEKFENFWEDMKDTYSDGLSLDRVDNDGNYCKENCRWANCKQQSRNQSMRKNNKSGVTGVFFSTKSAQWIAHWRPLGSGLCSKSFSVNKYGYDEAFDLACKYREKMIQQLNNAGAGYSEKHGMKKENKCAGI